MVLENSSMLAVVTTKKKGPLSWSLYDIIAYQQIMLINYCCYSIKSMQKENYYKMLTRGCESLKDKIRNRAFTSCFTFQQMIKYLFRVPPQTKIHPDYIEEISKELKDLKKLENSQFKDFRNKHYSMSIDHMSNLQYFWLLKNVQYFVQDFQLKLDQRFLTKKQQRRKKVEQTSYRQLWEKQEVLNYFQIIQEIYPFSQVNQLPLAESNENQRQLFKKDHKMFLICYLTLILKTINKCQQIKQLSQVRLKLVLVYSQLQSHYLNLERKDDPFEVEFLFSLLFLKISEKKFVEALETLFVLYYCFDFNEKEWFYRFTTFKQKNNLSFYLQTCMQVKIQQLIDASLQQKDDKFIKCITHENHISKIYFHQRKQQPKSRKWKKLSEKLYQQLQLIFGKELKDNDNFESIYLCINNDLFPSIFDTDILCSNNSQNTYYQQKLQAIQQGKQLFKITYSHLFYNCEKYNIYCLVIFDDNQQKEGILNLFKSNKINIIKATKKTYYLRIPEFNQTFEVVVVLFTKNCIKQKKQIIPHQNLTKEMEKYFHNLVHLIVKQRNIISLSTGIPFEKLLTAIEKYIIMSREDKDFTKSLRFRYYKLYIEKLCFLELKTDEKQQMKTAFFVLRQVMNTLRKILDGQWNDRPWFQRLLDRIRLTQNGGQQLEEELNEPINFQKRIDALSFRYSCNFFIYFYKASNMLYEKGLFSSDLQERQICLCALLNILNGQEQLQKKTIQLLLYFPALSFAYSLKSKKHLVRQQDVGCFYSSVERPYTIFASMIRTSLNDISDKLSQLGRLHFVKDELEGLKNFLIMLHPKNIPYTSDTLLDLDIQQLSYLDCQGCFFCQDYSQRCYGMLTSIRMMVRQTILKDQNPNYPLIRKYVDYIQCLYGVKIPLQNEGKKVKLIS